MFILRIPTLSYFLHYRHKSETYLNYITSTEYNYSTRAKFMVVLKVCKVIIANKNAIVNNRMVLLAKNSHKIS